jgi:hypothetical protein
MHLISLLVSDLVSSTVYFDFSRFSNGRRRTRYLGLCERRVANQKDDKETSILKVNVCRYTALGDECK